MPFQDRQETFLLNKNYIEIFKLFFFQLQENEYQQKIRVFLQLLQMMTEQLDYLQVKNWIEEQAKAQ